MDLIRILLALHPQRWRQTYGEEFAALLQETPLTPAAVADVVRHAAGLQARAHSGVLLTLAAAATSAGFEALALARNLTANILWAPTTPLRGLALAATVAPWGLLLARGAARRHARGT